MIELGKFNTLRVVKVVDFGVYLDGGDEWGEILMPKEYVPTNCFPDDDVRVFIYFDSEDRIVATTENPLVQVGEFALLHCVATSSVGAFLNWGLKKDLMVPFREQAIPMLDGGDYLVYAYVDRVTKRIVASSRIDLFIDQVPPIYEKGQKVDIIVARQTVLGYSVIVNNLHWGLVYKNEVFQHLKVGQKLVGFIKEVREDEKIDVVLTEPGYGKIDELSKSVLQRIKDYGGILDVSDKSSPEQIYNLFECSKKNFKKALGTLLKQGLIDVQPNEVRLK